MQIHVWPKGLTGRVILVLVCALVVELLASSIVFERAESLTTRAEQGRHLAEQLIVAARVLEATPAANRQPVARGLSTGQAQVSWRRASARQDRSQSLKELQLASDMQGWEPALAGRAADVQLAGADRLGGKVRLTASAGLSDGSRVVISSVAWANPWGLIWAGLGAAGVLSACVLIAAALLVRSLSSPLRALGRAAESVGEGAPVHVREEGARDLRNVARAFNAMQTRIGDLLTARTQALAAVSHDLRTPLARLRLRAGLVRDRPAREALERDVDEMAAMLESLLAYLGGQAEAEARRLTDLSAMCMTAVDAAVDAGQRAVFLGSDGVTAEVRTSAVRRALDNLVQNALNYGEGAEVSLLRDGEFVVLRVEDCGPGIPAAEVMRVREPFVRLDGARRRNTSGLGLGLSVAHSVAEAEGGELVLANRPEGGLRADLRVPAHPA
jgi:signal transduction histidine kinase